MTKGQILRTLSALLNALPDSIHAAPCWGWAWTDLNPEAQAEVAAARKAGERAKAILKTDEPVS